MRIGLNIEAVTDSHIMKVNSVILDESCLVIGISVSGQTAEIISSLKPPTFTSGENLFKEFISLLSSSYPKERMIGFYANQLYVTPKYLSAVCKEVSGQTASELITQYMVKDILYLLRNSQKSIKEIANELNFPNLSFFGKYVKQHLGMSPKQYRESSYG